MDGDTPLHYASNCGRTEITRLLLSHDNVDANIKNEVPYINMNVIRSFVIIVSSVIGWENSI